MSATHALERVKIFFLLGHWFASVVSGKALSALFTTVEFSSERREINLALPKIQSFAWLLIG
jgi:hypothetical protein